MFDMITNRKDELVELIDDLEDQLQDYKDQVEALDGIEDDINEVVRAAADEIASVTMRVQQEAAEEVADLLNNAGCGSMDLNEELLLAEDITSAASDYC